MGRIVSGSVDNTVRVWDVVRKVKRIGMNCRITRGWGEVGIVFWDGKRIVSGSNDGTVRVWDAEYGFCLHELKGHTDWVRSVSFSGDGKHIVSGSRDNTVRVWDAESGECVLGPLEGHTDYVMSVAFLEPEQSKSTVAVSPSYAAAFLSHNYRLNNK